MRWNPYSKIRAVKVAVQLFMLLTAQARAVFTQLVET